MFGTQEKIPTPLGVSKQTTKILFLGLPSLRPRLNGLKIRSEVLVYFGIKSRGHLTYKLGCIHHLYI